MNKSLLIHTLISAILGFVIYFGSGVVAFLGLIMLDGVGPEAEIALQNFQRSVIVGGIIFAGIVAFGLTLRKRKEFASSSKFILFEILNVAAAVALPVIFALSD